MNFHDKPDLFDDFLTSIEFRSNISDLLSTELQDSFEEHIVRLHDRVVQLGFLVLFAAKVADDRNNR